MPEALVKPCHDADQRLAAYREVLDQARSELLFYAPRLDGRLTDDAAALATLRTFLSRSARHHLRVLVCDPVALVRTCPRLVDLCRRLPSRCELRIPAGDAEPLDEALYCADRHHALHRPVTERVLHLHLVDHPLRIAPLRQRVEDLWEQAVESQDLRQLTL